MNYLKVITLLCVCFQWRADAQPVYRDTLPAVSVLGLTSHLRFLTSDSLKGRGNHTPELYTAATYIAGQYQRFGLKILSPLSNYFHPFYTKEGKRSSHANNNAVGLLNNVIGVLPGITKPQEIILIAAHYDHVGTTGPSEEDIHYGANDNASGVAALLSLAEYYAARKENDRTLIFCAFAGEELGLLGSTAFAKEFDPKAIVAMVNLEMLGRAKRKNAFFITGANESSFQKIMRKNLKGGKVRIINESSLEKQLFERSDNYPFALKGVSAHTIMSSDDDDACYHLPCDQLERLDIPNMALLIEGIIKGIATIVDGADTPSRIRR
jgi:Zn-dependent M28 family amino/carboxypeptidase